MQPAYTRLTSNLVMRGDKNLNKNHVEYECATTMFD